MVRIGEFFRNKNRFLVDFLLQKIVKQKFFSSISTYLENRPSPFPSFFERCKDCRFWRSWLGCHLACICHEAPRNLTFMIDLFHLLQQSDAYWNRLWLWLRVNCSRSGLECAAIFDKKSQMRESKMIKPEPNLFSINSTKRNQSTLHHHNSKQKKSISQSFILRTTTIPSYTKTYHPLSILKNKAIYSIKNPSHPSLPHLLNPQIQIKVGKNLI